MVNKKLSHRPTICYRAIQPSDLEALQRIHADVFPIRYEPEFFQNVVNRHDIVSWAAVDRSLANGQSDEVIGFVTARIVLAKKTEMGDLIRYDPLKPDQTLVYILTLGVVETYRNLGIGIVGHFNVEREEGFSHSHKYHKGPLLLRLRRMKITIVNV